MQLIVTRLKRKMLVKAAPRLITNNLTTIGGYAMTIKKAIEHFKDHQRTSLKEEDLGRDIGSFWRAFKVNLVAVRLSLSRQRNYADSLKPLRRD